jgi:hypothetical protein
MWLHKGLCFQEICFQTKQNLGRGQVFENQSGIRRVKRSKVQIPSAFKYLRRSKSTESNRSANAYGVQMLSAFRCLPRSNASRSRGQSILFLYFYFPHFPHFPIFPFSPFPIFPISHFPFPISHFPFPIFLFSHFPFPYSPHSPYLCPGDNLFYRIPACPRVRKVRTTQSAILPNGKVLRLNTVGTASATENIPSAFGG